MGQFLENVGLVVGKCWNVARGGLLLCYNKIPHAKVIMTQFLLLGRVLVLVRDSVGRR